jgi:proliferating cell nuclear antigen
MSQATLPAGKLNSALEAVTVLVDYATLQFGPDGLSIETVDAASIGAVTLSLLSGAFKEYEGSSFRININVERLAEITRRIDKSQSVTLVYDKDSHELRLDTGSYEFELTLVDPTSVHSGQRAAEIDPPSEVVLDSRRIHQAIQLGGMFTDEVIMGMDSSREVFYLNASGDNDSMAVSFEREDEVISSMTPEPAHSIYSLEYLNEMMGEVPSENDVKIQFGEEFPARIHFDIADGNGRVVYGLAPRIQG